jgi:hypothetical protein
VSEWHDRLAQPGAKMIEGGLSKEGGRQHERMHYRTDVVADIGKRQRTRSTSATRRIGTFQDRHGVTGLRQCDGRSQTVGTRAHNHCVYLRHWWSREIAKGITRTVLSSVTKGLRMILMDPLEERTTSWASEWPSM